MRMPKVIHLIRAKEPPAHGFWITFCEKTPSLVVLKTHPKLWNLHPEKRCQVCVAIFESSTLARQRTAIYRAPQTERTKNYTFKRDPVTRKKVP